MHVEVPACVATNVCAPTVIVPVRVPASPLASREYDTRRLPVPSPPGGSNTRIQPERLDASQAHVGAALTANWPEPPPTGNCPSSGSIESEQPVTPDCVTAWAAPPTVTFAVRDEASAFGATA